MPLIFGTFKATLFAMLFAVPLALLGAIYTSQFMSPNPEGADQAGG
jgi:phosphate transport system permease protein